MRYSFNDTAIYLSGTIPASCDYNWMKMRRDVYVVVAFGDVGRVRSCTVGAVFTLL